MGRDFNATTISSDFLSSAFNNFTTDVTVTDFLNTTSVNSTETGSNTPKKKLLTKQFLFVLSVQFLATVFIFFGNCLILLAIRKAKRLKKVTYSFVGHLALADLIFGFSLTVRASITLSGTMTKEICLTIMGLSIASVGCSITGILFLCLDSYLCVKYVNIFKTTMTPKVAYVMIFCTWVFWLGYGFSSLIIKVPDDGTPKPCSFTGGYYTDNFMLIMFTLTFLHLIPIIFFQVNTMRSLNQHFKQLASHGQISTNNNDMENFNGRSKQDISAMQAKWLKSVKSTNMIIIFVLILFLLTWPPFFIVLLLQIVCPSCGVSATVTTQMATLSIFNSFLNVFIYVSKSPEFRNSLKKAVCRSCITQVQPEDASVTMQTAVQ